MSQELQTFTFEGTQVRVTTGGDGEPRWVLADVCRACGIDNSRNVSARLDDDQKGVVTMDTLGGAQKITVVTESGLYDVILDSRKQEAKRFRKWVTGEVLPSIRKHGAYMTQQTIEQVLTDPDTLIRLATDLKYEREARAQAERQVRSLAPKAQAFEDFVDVPDLLTIREAAKLLTTADIQIRESELRAWLVMHKWIYRKGGDYEPYASHVQAGHIRLVAHRSSGRHSDGSRFAFAPTCKLTRRGLILLYQRIGSEQMRNRLPLTAARSEQPNWWQEEETANVVSAHERQAA